MTMRRIVPVVLTAGLLAVAAPAPAHATSLTYEPELAPDTTNGVRVDFGLAVHLTSSPVGDWDVCATDKAVFVESDGGGGVEGGTTGTDC